MCWYSGDDKHFYIKPATLKISPFRTASFEVYFCPSTKETLYGSELELYFHFEAEKGRGPRKQRLPICLTLRAHGHSYKPPLQTWVPRYELSSQDVHFPPLRVNGKVGTTIALRNSDATMPVYFRFLPKEGSPFVIKPMQGVILGTAAIIVVHLDTRNSTEEITYSETREVVLNGDIAHSIHVRLYVQSYLPRAAINSNNKIEFPSVLVGSKFEKSVFLRNTCRQPISFDITPERPGSKFRLSYRSGFLQANEKVHLKYAFVPEDNVQYNEHHILKTMYLSVKVEEQLEQTHTICLHGAGSLSGIVAVPEKKDFGSVTVGEFRTTDVMLINNSESDIEFVLEMLFKERHMASIVTVDLSPKNGVVHRGDSISIGMSIICSSCGECNFSLAYLTGKPEDQSEESKKYIQRVCEFQLVAEYPSLQVLDIQHDSTGTRMGRYRTFDLLNIEALNNRLRTPAASDKLLTMRLASCVADSSPTTIKLLLGNSGKVPLTWQLELYKKPSTKTVRRVQRNFKGWPWLDQLQDTIRLMQHKKIFKISPTHGKLQEKETVIIEIKQFHTTIGCHQYPLTLHIPFHSTINVVLVGCTIHKLTNYIQVLQTEMSLLPVCIDQLESTHQVFWLRNSSDHVTTYMFDLEPLTELSKENFEAQIISCLNPSGTIQPHRNAPVLFTFNPIQEKTYEVFLPLNINNGTCHIKFTGQGVKSEVPYARLLRRRTLPRNALPEESLPVRIEPDHLFFDNAPVGEQASQIVFLTSKAELAVLSFEWIVGEADSMALIEVNPRNGLLTPGEHISCKLSMTGHSMPSLFTTEVLCVVYNETIRSKHERQCKLVIHEHEKSEAEFIIQHDGTMGKQLPEQSGKINSPELPLRYECFVAVSAYIPTFDAMMKIRSIRDILTMPPADGLSQVSPLDFLTAENLRNKDVACFIVSYTIRYILRQRGFSVSLGDLSDDSIWSYDEYIGNSNCEDSPVEGTSLECTLGVLRFIMDEAIEKIICELACEGNMSEVEAISNHVGKELIKELEELFIERLTAGETESEASTSSEAASDEAGSKEASSNETSSNEADASNEASSNETSSNEAASKEASSNEVGNSGRDSDNGESAEAALIDSEKKDTQSDDFEKYISSPSSDDLQSISDWEAVEESLSQ